MRRYCVVSSFKTAFKVPQDELELYIAPRRWLRELKARYGLTELPLDSAVCSAAVELPHHHRDTFDRFMITAARRLQVPVVTIDAKFSPYAVEVLA